MADYALGLVLLVAGIAFVAGIAGIAVREVRRAKAEALLVAERIKNQRFLTIYSKHRRPLRFEIRKWEVIAHSDSSTSDSCTKGCGHWLSVWEKDGRFLIISHTYYKNGSDGRYDDYALCDSLEEVAENLWGVFWSAYHDTESIPRELYLRTLNMLPASALEAYTDE